MELMLIFILLMVTLEGIGKVNRNHGNQYGQGGTAFTRWMVIKK